MRKLVAVVICAALALPAAAAARTGGLLRTASKLSGLSVRRGVPIVVQSPARFDADAARALDRAYPRTLQRLDDVFYMDLGLLPAEQSSRAALVGGASPPAARYDVGTRVLRVRGAPAPRRRELLYELVRALVDQHYNLRRLDGLRTRDRDAALAATATVDGFGSFVAGLRVLPRPAAPIDRFLATERAAGVDAGRNLIARLNEIGGAYAVRTALRTFPRTTEQLLHVDKFLQRERAASVPLANHLGDLTLITSETFGELDVRALLGAFADPAANDVAAGWGGGRIALYRGAPDQSATALVLRWDTPEDAEEWRAAAQRYVAAAFPAAQRRSCPAVDECWLVGTREIASAANDDVTVLASGTEAEVLAALLSHPSTSSRG